MTTCARRIRVALLTALVVAVLAGRATAQQSDDAMAHPGDHAAGDRPAIAQPLPQPVNDGLANHDRLESSLRGWLGLWLSLIGVAGLIAIAALIWALGNRRVSEREHDFAGGGSSTARR